MTRSAVLLLCAACVCGLALVASAAEDRGALPLAVERVPRVLIELFVMSRCPDARRAEDRFNEVLKQVHSIVDLRTLYIAGEGPDGSVACKHGPAECAGNVQQLCAALHGRHGIARGEDPFQRGWSFLQCQNNKFSDVGSEELAEECLEAAGFSGVRAAAARACWSGPEGGALLRYSAAEARRRGAAKSCTVYVDGQYRCTHDSAQWYDCPGGSEVSDFVNTLCASYRRLTGRWPEDVCGPEPGAAA
ncbi:hypothetical protein GPECTOR_112g269 [Gonium pectorale]|uniref:Gamma-interferon-inducible lysosomal thiol reductase n=1 Tax=Gonium pectorale TaxID=33097 RepID=A0A150FZ87_GONPE|nr:hypothetical protein GPECTOR_112g269 [Gonium pectorale]|eukprot:KXZ42899.1 hypothetical protein GPECTOR_112g269 [Gonium pectorale]